MDLTPLMKRMVDVLLCDDTVDVVAVNLRANVPQPGGWAPSRQFTTNLVDALQTPRNDRLVVGFSSFAGGDLDMEVVRPLAEVGVPFLEGSESAMLALRHAREHRRFLQRGGEDRSPVAAPGHGDAVAQRPGSVLGNAEAMELLRTFGIPLAETVPAKGADDAVRAAERFGYPVVLKIDSPDILHKTDAGGVRVGCATADAVRLAFREMTDEVRRRAPAARVDGVLVQPMVTGGTEMSVGVKRDPVFGPAVVCGFGGVFVEVMRDVAVRVPPFDAAEARAMIAELRGSALLRGARGRPPGDVAALADTLVRVATLAEAQGEALQALDINPLLVLEGGRGVVAVDWLVELDTEATRCPTR